MDNLNRWLLFTTQKEIKRIHNDINSTIAFKIQLAVSCIAIIFSVCGKEELRLAFILSSIVVFTFIVPIIIQVFSHLRRANKKFSEKEVKRIFDDEITYFVLTACEFFEKMEEEKSGNSELSCEKYNFYRIEVKYYIVESIRKLADFNSSNDRVKRWIGIERLQNVVKIIDYLIHNVAIDLGDLSDDYNMIHQHVLGEHSK